MTKRPSGFPRSTWFHMSQHQRRWWFQFWPRLASAMSTGLTLPARNWFAFTPEIVHE